MSNIVPWQDQERMAQAISKSGLFGLKDTNQVLALMAVAQAEGRHPASVARDYHVIQGRPALKADAMLARFQAAGGSVEWLAYTDEKVEAKFSHPQGGTLTLAWTFAQAKQIGLTGKDNWKNYPRAMLRARVVSEGIRTVYPGVLVGEYTPEEVQDFKELAPAVVDVTPVPQIEPVQEDIGEIPLYVPDGEGERIYKKCATTKEWMETYNNLLGMIQNSKKLEEAEKFEKEVQFRSLNLEIWKELNRE